MFHMKETKIGGSACVLVLLFSGLVTGSGVFGSPMTDDVDILDKLSENLPEDYNISVCYISKEVGGACWLHLNLFPVEESLKTLASKFGNHSLNRENISIFITMLQGLRSTFDHEELEAIMQVFKCHYRNVSWTSRRYFDHVKEVLKRSFSPAPPQFHCTLPPCPTVPPTTPGQGSQKHAIDSVIPSLLALLIIPCVATLALLLRTVLRRGGCRLRRRCVTDVHRFPAADGSGSQSDPEDGSGAANNDTETSSLNKQCRAQQDTLGSEETAV
ncbi:kit ligand b isoform X2 [Hoplias malabaricus]|uniref:kit ligand b isoform X2 n=1 Tax=Hoplias malabaricus TaxID=27720 RepID=UPI003462CD8E